jgi:hypothetical protein
MNRHTSEPWETGTEFGSGDQNYLVVETPKGYTIALVPIDDGMPYEANANLISVAPNLLKVLELIVEMWDVPTYGDLEARCDHVFDGIEAARTVIARYRRLRHR